MKKIFFTLITSTLFLISASTVLAGTEDPGSNFNSLNNTEDTSSVPTAPSNTPTITNPVTKTETLPTLSSTSSIYPS